MTEMRAKNLLVTKKIYTKILRRILSQRIMMTMMMMILSN